MWLIMFDGVYKEQYIETLFDFPVLFNLHWDYRIEVKNNQTSSFEFKNLRINVGSFQVGDNIAAEVYKVDVKFDFEDNGQVKIGVTPAKAHNSEDGAKFPLISLRTKPRPDYQSVQDIPLTTLGFLMVFPVCGYIVTVYIKLLTDQMVVA